MQPTTNLLMAGLLTASALAVFRAPCRAEEVFPQLTINGDVHTNVSVVRVTPDEVTLRWECGGRAVYYRQDLPRELATDGQRWTICVQPGPRALEECHINGRFRWFVESKGGFLLPLTAVTQEVPAVWQLNNAAGESFMADSTSNATASASPGALCSSRFTHNASGLTYPLPYFLEPR